MKRFGCIAIICSLGLVLFSSCAVELKPYERVYVNDQEMQMITRTEDGFKQYVHSIREGSVTPLGKKGNGGCGCN